MKFTAEEIKNRLKQLKGWFYDEQGDRIFKEFKFKNFREAMAFVLKVAFESEKVDHHPDILIEYNQVKIYLRTHSLNGVTEKDFNLAEKIDEILRVD